MSIDRILEKLDITRLNPMQEEAFDSILHGTDDVIVLSPTGSGKTLAYLLPLIEKTDAGSDAVQAVVIVPGRELAMQSDNVLRSTGTAVRSAACYGGRAAMDEHRMLRQRRPNIIFGTPGRLNDHIDKGNIDAGGVRYLVIDEFDKCLQMGFADEMSRLVGRLHGVRQRILLSATDARQIPDFIDISHCVRLDHLDGGSSVPERVKLYEARSAAKDKLEPLARLLGSFGAQSSIVFLNYRESVERTAGYLRGAGFSVSHYHGGMEQRLREDALYKFSNGSANVLVSTDLASRGLDIPEVDNIVHYHLPQTADEYIHRVGRTARWDASGRTFFLLGPEETLPEFVEEEPQPFDIPDDFRTPEPAKMTTIYIGKGKKDKLSKGDIVGFLCKKGGLKAGEIGRIDVKDRYTYAAISRPRLDSVLRQTAGEKIKGIKTVVEPVG